MRSKLGLGGGFPLRPHPGTQGWCVMECRISFVRPVRAHRRWTLVLSAGLMPPEMGVAFFSQLYKNKKKRKEKQTRAECAGRSEDDRLCCVFCAEKTPSYEYFDSGSYSGTTADREEARPAMIVPPPRLPASLSVREWTKQKRQRGLGGEEVNALNKELSVW